MRFEIIILLITGLVIANVYTDGKYLRLAYGWTKYYKMIGIGFAGIALCWLLRKDPNRARQMLTVSSDYINYLPIDKNINGIVSPILNFNTNSNYGGGYTEKTFSGGGEPNRSKRAVGETKKKFIASRQSWKCGECNNTLQATFEIDHTIRLDKGGSNDISNLVALCPNCHRMKTSFENMGML